MPIAILPITTANEGSLPKPNGLVSLVVVSGVVEDSNTDEALWLAQSYLVATMEDAMIFLLSDLGSYLLIDGQWAGNVHSFLQLWNFGTVGQASLMARYRMEPLVDADDLVSLNNHVWSKEGIDDRTIHELQTRDLKPALEALGPGAIVLAVEFKVAEGQP